MTDPPAVPEPTAPSVPPKMRPLRMRHVLAAVLVGLLVLGLALFADWLFLQPTDHDAWADVVRSTVLALGLLGAVPAGYVAYRKQQTTEAEHAHDQRKERQRQVEHDDANDRATAKDFRDRYTAAATQLGSDKAPIRLAGVYALAQLADEWGRTEPEQRQTCIDVLCSYLRMPWSMTATDDAPDQEKLDKKRLHDEETRVRETIVRVIATHLHEDRSPDSGWHQNSFDFTGAELPEVRMLSIRLEGAFIADGATFSEEASFYEATFSRFTRFTGATFSGVAWFDGATFREGAGFDGATFSEDASFVGAHFSGITKFSRATFSEHAQFSWATFSEHAQFSGATFSEDASFDEATFPEDARFALVISDEFGTTVTKPPFVDGATISGRLIRTDGSEEAPTDPRRPFQPHVRPADDETDPDARHIRDDEDPDREPVEDL